MDLKPDRLFVSQVNRGDRLTSSQIQAIVNALVGSIRSDTISVSRLGNNIVLDAVRPPAHRDHFLAKITGNSALTAGAKWKYAWTEVRLSANDDGAKTGARSGTTSSKFALNLVELNNPSAGAVGGDGIDPAGADYPAGYDRLPIGTGSVDVVVMMYVVVDASGDKRYVFSQPNAHDGTCM